MVKITSIGDSNLDATITQQCIGNMPSVTKLIQGVSKTYTRPIQQARGHQSPIQARYALNVDLDAIIVNASATIITHVKLQPRVPYHYTVPQG